MNTKSKAANRMMMTAARDLFIAWFGASLGAAASNK
jgi:hypothetical protein